MSTIAHIGEFGLIGVIKEKFTPHHHETIVGIDDDCAVTEGREGFYTIYTCDSQVEGSHFITHLVPPYLLGQKVLSVNLSDIAAMGGMPRFALLSLVLRSTISIEWVDTFLEGFRRQARQYQVDVIGGNLAHTQGELILDVTVVGEIKRERLLLRNQASIGDLIMVTGFLGDAGAGLKILLEEQPINAKRNQYLLNRYFLPDPRIEVGKILADSDFQMSLIDVSDGFTQDLGHIMKQSRVGAVIESEKIPLSNPLRLWCSEHGYDPLDFALSGGEDYELIFTVSPREASSLQKEIQQKTGVPVSIVGEITDGDRLHIRKNDEEMVFHSHGWNHFSF